MKRNVTLESRCVGCESNPCVCKTPPRLKCDKSDICTSLLRHLNQHANHGKGLSSFVLTDMKTFESSFAGVVYRDKASDRGVLINYCPWCGKSLAHFLKPHLKKGGSK